MKKSPKEKKKFWSILSLLGPGLVTGASDDDPSGIATYSQAGAKFGLKFLWTSLATYPLIAGMQVMCAKIGLITGKGLTGVIKQYYPKYILYIILLASFPSIILNIGADIAGMGAVGNMLFPKIPDYAFSILFMGTLMLAVIAWKYHRIAFILKWLCAALVCYLIIPFVSETNWRELVTGTFIPKFSMTKEYFMTLVGILGTTISPYLFFWQANMEVEERSQKHLIVDKKIIIHMKEDVRIGILLSNVVSYFIILTTGTVLFQNGVTEINTVDQAADALRPLAGNSAYILFAIGILGTGALAIPVLAGSLSYMLSEVFNWKEGLDRKFSEAKGFYMTLIVSMLIGLLIDFIDISPIKILFYTAVLYGIVAPIIIALIIHMCNNPKIMGKHTNKPMQNIVGLITLAVMTGCAIILFVI